LGIFPGGLPPEEDTLRLAEAVAAVHVSLPAD